MVIMIKKHIDRIKWRISNGGWKANQLDLDALNGIIEYANKEQDETFAENEQFAKLYIYLYLEFLRYFDCTVYEKQPEKTIQSILNRSLDVLLDDLIYTINQQNLYDRLKENGFQFGHPLQLKEDVKKKNLEIMESTNGEKFTKEEVSDNITAMVNTALQIKTKTQ